MDEQEYFQRELQLSMLSMARGSNDLVSVLVADKLYTLYLFVYQVKIQGRDIITFDNLKCFKN